MGDPQRPGRSSLPFRSSQPCWQAGRCDLRCSEMPHGRGVDNTGAGALEVREFILGCYWVGFTEESVELRFEIG